MKNMPAQLVTILFLIVLFLPGYAQPLPDHNLKSNELPTTWDEGFPLGNGAIGALIWENNGALRFSLDRADIWDQRPMKGLHRKEFSFAWVKEQLLKNQYEKVQEYFDKPYDHEPAPSKIPAGALEFAVPENIAVTSAELHLKDAVCEIHWANGMKLQTFVHATETAGWFRFENYSGEFAPRLVPPPYQKAIAPGTQSDPVAGNDLARLGYKQGLIEDNKYEISYKQEGWNGFRYHISVRWKIISPGTIEGVWSISSHDGNTKNNPPASELTDLSLQAGMTESLAGHLQWWNAFWRRSSIRIPDPVLEKQWYLEQYKFGSTARANTPPISLQAVWTADNGRIPPWKGDFHHDLNTQLSYWPAYSANHLEDAMGYLNHLDENKANYKRYTKRYFGLEGLNVPGVTTLDGTEMGGWIQYSLSPTVSAWLAHHYYLQWRYSMDRDFLKDRAYPWFHEVCHFLEQITSPDENGIRQLPLSSSPEINDNKPSAWFIQNTNYDLALMKFAFTAAAELAGELELKEDATRWKKVLSEFGGFALTENKEMKFAPGLPYNESHRHFSHLMAIHPLGLINWEDGDEARRIITSTLAQLEAVGPDYWAGYSYSWLANLYARAKDGTNAARTLEIFARAFCLPNSFHANGDQTKSGYSKLTYRPFTLEGNMAFAAGLQEMLLQSYAGFIDIMPALPDHWREVSFNGLRAEGAFLVSAEKKNGQIAKISITAEKGGNTKLKLPFRHYTVITQHGLEIRDSGDDTLFIDSQPGGTLVLQSGN